MKVLSNFQKWDCEAISELDHGESIVDNLALRRNKQSGDEENERKRRLPPSPI